MADDKKDQERRSGKDRRTAEDRRGPNRVETNSQDRRKNDRRG